MIENQLLHKKFVPTPFFENVCPIKWIIYMYLSIRTFIKFGILLNLIKYCDKPRANPDIFKREGWGTLYLRHHGWPAKKILGFRWSKKAEVRLETISFWQKFSNALIRKEKKHSYCSQWEKKNWEKWDFVL